jgi:hypothetical protein
MATTDYCTLNEFKQYVGLDDTIDDTVIKRAITASSIAVDNFCKTRFGKSFPNTVRVFDTCDTWRVRVDPVVAVTELATDEDRDGTFETVWASTDFQLLPLNAPTAPEPEPSTEIHAIADRSFPRVSSSTSRHGLTRVTGTWGWPAIPIPVTQATLLLVNRAIKRRNSPEGVASFDEFGTIRISARDDPDAVRYLMPYKTTRRRGGWALA